MRKIEIEPELLLAMHWGNMYSIQDIAYEFGCSYGAIMRSMKEYDIERRIDGYRSDFNPFDNYKDRAIFRELKRYEMNRRRKRKKPAQVTGDSNFDAYFAQLRIRKKNV
ncbi:unnamed protein product [marine sediment metagenome]|uniref:Uncharacterized protein n=1 Tax=marine sediment metagenome TaxID=412755 RepID=X1MJM6_9ZZZZ